MLVVLSTTTCAAARPNVIVIMADDLGYAAVGYNGCKGCPHYRVKENQ